MTKYRPPRILEERRMPGHSAQTIYRKHVNRKFLSHSGSFVWMAEAMAGFLCSVQWVISLGGTEISAEDIYTVYLSRESSW